MAAIPADVRSEVIEELVRQFDAARWEELSSPEASGMYDRFVKDPKIGGRLSTYMPADKVRVWIKDGPAKEYRRALEGIGPVASFTKRAYPGPESVVRLALGDRWVPKKDTTEEKPMRCFAKDPEGQSMFVIWGPLSALQGLIWNSCLIRAEDPLKPITVVVTRPTSASLPSDDWELVKRLCDIVDADCRQVTYAVSRKPSV
ncbi:hypothetical protein ACOCJ7_09645 [Knoellia sp. CPCC 206453]|uniref:hypothetical protein n=1 Tax=Knoellia pratensis TaxID=3404796 RepID=UPI0036203FC7